MLLTSLKTLLLIFLLTALGCGSDSPSCEPCPDGGTGSGADGCCDGGIDVDAAIDAPFVCDPVAQTGCSSGACYSDATGTGTTTNYTYECAAPGAGTDGASCVANTDCAAGYWCAKGGLNKCTHYCTTDAQCTAPGSPKCVGNTDTPWGYCACITNPGIGTCP